MNIQKRMAWQDYMTDEERAELAKAETAFAAAMEKIAPLKEQRDALRRTLKIRCDARMRRSGDDE